VGRRKHKKIKQIVVIFFFKIFIIMTKKFIITEEERFNILGLYKIINEQKPDSMMPFQIEKFGYKQGKPETLKPALEKQEQAFQEIESHAYLMALQIATAFVPVLGPFLSAGFGLADAGLYYKQGRNKEAGMSAMFAMLPGIGSIVGKIPFIKILGSKGMKTLCKKLIRNGNKAKLNPQEAQVVKGLAEDVNFVTQELSKESQKMASNALKTTQNSKVVPVLKSIAKGGLKFAGTTAAYAGAGYGYDKTYNYFNPEPQFSDLNIDMYSPVPEQSKKIAAAINWND
jgi:hypothetical protein